MAWLQQTPASGGRAASPTVFEQQREELVREIAVVCTVSTHSRPTRELLSPQPVLIIRAGHGASTSKHEPSESESRKCYCGEFQHWAEKAQPLMVLLGGE
jgi:hypothetical protein